ncbi:NAD-dependent epimerase/dehydratase family protein [Rhodococcus sp. SGAir0479]|uniref:NAD-dependent epimerase/dehydratase family protein n=1 Tax=Rhodococcus sp. SGAir0479 TaxID=2567884 RepID=UPI0010CD4974|nr:NAD-dependent epimerase/dehydratase family protein [Rhodococcus sp. SGAir0479]QCQ91355.1 NAD-dependent epimerase/dehydratase family protein [Rhodococcus sp. SGAir0479]
MSTGRRRGPRRVVVTGGAGFLGLHLCTRLARRGDSVICVDDFSTSAPWARSTLSALDRVTVIDSSVTDPPVLPRRIDLLVHLACPASPRDYQNDAVGTLVTGGLGTLEMLDRAQASGARFVLASTSEVYGDPDVHPQPEAYRGNVDPVGPRSMYDEAKRFAEALASAFRRQHGTDTAIVRIFNSYGPGMRADDGRMVPAFVCAALDGRPLPVAGTGRQTRSLCYVDDTVSGIIALADSDHPGPINIGSAHEVSVLDVAATVNRIAHSDAGVRFVPAAPDDPRRRCPDVALARRTLGWHARVSLENGLRRTVEWFARPSRDRTYTAGGFRCG